VPDAPQPDRLSNLYYGGQAVMEGVMIRGPKHMAVAVRHPKGHIVIHAEALSSIYTGVLRKVPLLRGMIILWETLVLGMRALTFSSRVALEEEDKDGKPADFPEGVIWGSMALAMVFAVGIFFAAPILLANLLERADATRVWVVAAETAIRLSLFVGYIWLIGRIPEIRRVFQYHGAEHMTIHAYERGRRLVPGEVRGFPKEHERCGTSFLLIVIMVALVAFFVFDVLVDEGVFVRIASRVFLLPPIAGVSYEILRFGARFNDSPIVKALFRPNILLQGLTTKNPDDSQIEVAIASFEAVLDVSGLKQPSVAPATVGAPADAAT
jgi:uncharacterized protein YqhQ